MQNVQEFIRKSSVAEKIKLTPHIVLHRMELDPGQVSRLLGSESFLPDTAAPSRFVMEANGVPVARGEIVEKENEYFFRVIEIKGKETE